MDGPPGDESMLFAAGIEAAPWTEAAMSLPETFELLVQAVPRQRQLKQPHVVAVDSFTRCKF